MLTMDQRLRYGRWAVWALAGVVLFVSWGFVPLMDPDESRFARTSVEMLRDGDVVVPHFQGEPRLVKPPLLHWLQSALFSLFGVSAWVARLHAGLATLATLLLVGWAARRRFGDEGALWATLIAATMPLLVVVGRVGTLDALLALHVFAVVALDIADLPAGRYRGLVVGGLLGLAFMVKGPVGVLLPLLVMLCGRTALRRELWPGAIAVLQALVGWAVVVLPWSLALIRRIGLDAVVELLRNESLQRYFDSFDHARPPWFYLAVLIVGCVPWFVPLISGLFRAAWRWREPDARTGLYSAAGLVGGVVFFSLSRGKMPNYLLPLLPLAALLATWEIGQLIRRPGRRFAVPALTVSTLGLLAFTFGAAGRSQLTGPLQSLAFAGAAIYALGMLACLPALLRRDVRRLFGTVGASALVFLLIAMLFLPPLVARQRSAYLLVQEYEPLRSERPLVVVEMKVPSLTFYLDRIPEEIFLDGLEKRLESDDDALYLFADVDLPQVAPEMMAGLLELGRSGKFVLFARRGRTAPEAALP